MLISYQINECKGCDDIVATLSSIDKRLSSSTKIMYNNLVYMDNKKVDRRKIKDLVYYKWILTKMALNHSLFPYNYKQIISQIKTLI